MFQSILNYTICFPTQNGKSQHYTGKEGSYGVVKRAIESESKSFVAIKFLKRGITEEGLSCSAIREITFLKELEGHENIIRLKKTIFFEKQLYLVFDFIDFNLSEFISTYQINPYLTKKFLYEILNAIEFAHSRRIMHRDLKPENIMVRAESSRKIPKIQIADWGISRSFFHKKHLYTRTVASFHYRAPQIFLGDGDYSQAIDIWSIGCIFAEMVLGRKLFGGNSQLSQLLIIANTLGLPIGQSLPVEIKLSQLSSLMEQYSPSQCFREKMKGLDDSGFELLKVIDSLEQMMLEINPQRRISARKALNHQYFKNRSE